MVINFQSFILISSGKLGESPVTDMSFEEDQEGPSELDVARAETAAAKAETEAAEAALEATLALLESAQNDLALAKVQIDKLQTQLKISRFGLERFLADGNSIKFYTGFPSYSHLYKVFEILQPSAERMTYVYSAGMNSQQSRPLARTMILIDEFFLFLVRVRVGLLAQDLADRFQIHISTVSRKVITWANYLYFFWGNQVIWPSREQVDTHMPQGFKRLYPRTRVILDCTEIFAHTPSSLLLQSQLYSTYKSNTTLKGLVGIAPHGAITFVSSLYTGSISDKEITRVSGILDLLEPGDVVMADKGFEIGSMLMGKGVGLNLPPFLQSSRQFTAEQVQETKKIAKLRIHVERAIRRIKEFHIFDSPIPLNLLGTINQLYTVICLLVNFQGPMILSSAEE